MPGQWQQWGACGERGAPPCRTVACSAYLAWFRAAATSPSILVLRFHIGQHDQVEVGEHFPVSAVATGACPQVGTLCNQTACPSLKLALPGLLAF